MAAYTTQTAGNWWTAANWKVDSTGLAASTPPGSGDTTTLTKSMTVDGNLTIGASNGQFVSGSNSAAIQLNSGGRLILAPGVKVTLRGDVTVNTGYNIAATGVTMGAGCVFEFDSSTTSPTTQYRFMNLTTSNQPGFSFVCNGTQAAPCYIQSNAGGANGRIFANGFTSALGSCTATWTYFVRLGTSSQNMWETGENAIAGVLNLQNCTIDSCGMWHTSAAATAAGYATFQNCVWKNSLNANYNIDISQYASYKNCVFDRIPPTQSNTYTGLSLDTCYSHMGLPTGAVSNTWTLFTNNFIRFLSNSGYTAQGDMSKSITFMDHNQTNPHWIAMNKNFSGFYSDMLFDHSDTDGSGDTFLSPVSPASTRQTYTFRRCIVMPNAGGNDAGVAFTFFGAAASGACIFDYQHGTYHVGSQGAVINETGSQTTGALAALKNCIAWDFPNQKPLRGFVLLDSGHQVSSAGLTTDTVLPANADYNVSWNVTQTNVANTPWFTNQGRGYQAAFSSPPGVHDLNSVNPMFRDPSRNTATFDTAYFGNVAGTTWASHATTDSFGVGDVVSNNNPTYYGWISNNVINFRCILAHAKSTANSEPGAGSNWRTYWELSSLATLRNAVARGAAGPPVTYSDSKLRLFNVDVLTLLRSWITDGFTPLNPLLRNAGDDGTDIGAAPTPPVVASRQALPMLFAGASATQRFKATNVSTTQPLPGTAVKGQSDTLITASAIPSAAVVGAVSLSASQAFTLVSIASGEDFGIPALAAAAGPPVIGDPQTLHVSGLPSLGDFGLTTIVATVFDFRDAVTPSLRTVFVSEPLDHSAEIPLVAPKAPDEVLDYRLDMSAELAASLAGGDDTIVSVHWSIAGGGGPALAIDRATHDGATATVWLRDGTLNETYEVAAQMYTTGGRVFHRSFRIAIVDR